MTKTKRVHSRDVAQATTALLHERGVTVLEIAKIVFEMQLPFNPELLLDECITSVERVLRKREIQHAILVGIELDRLAEKKLLSEPLQSIVESDEGLFGIDETIGLGAVLTYGSIAVTTYGFLDKNKIGIIKQLDTKTGNGVHTFLDDLVASIAACAASRIAHQSRDLEEVEEDLQENETWS